MRFDKPARLDPIVAQRSQEGHGPLAAVRDLAIGRLPRERPAAPCLP